MTGQPIWSLRFMDRRNSRNIEELADANPHMRRLTRMMLMNIGAKLVYEGADGLSALDIIRHANPDVMLLDREMPLLGGPQKPPPVDLSKVPQH
jgi:AmiR/NasT family two-component response regulator